MGVRNRVHTFLVPTGTITPWRDALSFLLFALTIASGILALWLGGRNWRIALGLITAASLALLVLRLVQALYTQQVTVTLQELEDARTTITELEASFQRYKISVERQEEIFDFIIDALVEGQVWAYEEALEITIWVENDKIRERHTTRPIATNGHRRLPYRTCRPIVPSRNPRLPAVTYNDLDMLGRLENDDGRTIRLMQIQTSKAPIRMIGVFWPPLEDEATWVLDYVSPGLWDPLRRTGTDDFWWETRSPGVDDTESPFSLLRVNFVFPQNTKEFFVSESSGAGSQNDVRDHTLGPTITWETRTPAAKRFRWEVSCPSLVASQPEQPLSPPES